MHAEEILQRTKWGCIYIFALYCMIHIITAKMHRVCIGIEAKPLGAFEVLQQPREGERDAHS